MVYNEGTPDEVVALRGISMRVQRGETLIITGGNGSGKSTLLKAIAGTAPVKSGAISIAGTDVTRWPAHQRAKVLGFIHQDPLLGTCPNMTVYENLRLVSGKGWWRPIPEQIAVREDQAALIRSSGLPLDQKMGTQMSSLSGGQRQGAAMILALTSRRHILLLDEFTSSLDDCVRASYLQMIATESARRKLTIIGVMHDLHGIEVLNHRSLRLVGGCRSRISFSVAARERLLVGNGR